MSVFWKNALSIMKEKKLKQLDLIKATGKTRSGVSAWITRDIIPTADDALRIADLLEVSVRYLVTGQRQEGELEPREKELLRECSILRDESFKLVLDCAKLMRKAAEQELSAASSSGASEHKAK